jgi:predicted dehydrogenase
MAISPQDAKLIDSAREHADRIVFVGYMRRYATAFLRVKEIVTSLTKGQINYGELHG